MKRLALIAVLSAVAFPAAAQYGTWGTNQNGALYWKGEQPPGTIYQQYGAPALEQYRQRSTTCTTYGNQTTCTSN